MTTVCAVLLLLHALHNFGQGASFSLMHERITSKVDRDLFDDATILPPLTQVTPYIETDDSATAVPPAEEGRFRLHRRALPWLEALQTCWRCGEQLAVPRSRADAVHLGRLLLASAFNVTHTSMVDAMHVAVHDTADDGKWRTLDGLLLSEAGYDLWLEGGRGRCGALLADGRYIRQPCSAVLAFACEAATPTTSQATDSYTRIAGVGLFRLYEEPLPWTLALQRCEAEGATLAVPASAREAGLLAGVLLTRADDHARLREHGFFVGITDVAQESEWRTVGGQILSEAGYDVWSPDEPSGGREQNCGALLEDGRYADYPCLVPMGYCCQLRHARAVDGEQILVNGRFRLFFRKLRWMEALHACQLLNSSLAVSKSSQDESAMKSLISQAKTKISGFENYVHVGIHDIEETGHWRTLAGDSAWSSRHYDNRSYTRTKSYDTIGYCGRMEYNGRYSSSPCERKYPYICEVLS